MMCVLHCAVVYLHPLYILADHSTINVHVYRIVLIHARYSSMYGVLCCVVCFQNLSQFWYDDETALTLAQEALNGGSKRCIKNSYTHSFTDLHTV